MRQKWLVALVYTIGVLSVWAGAGTQPRKYISFTEHNRPLVNPYMGWGLWAEPRYYDGRPFTVTEYCSTLRSQSTSGSRR